MSDFRLDELKKRRFDQETKEVISLHGLGFIQVKLGGSQRLHVWHPELPRRQCFAHSQIHDHRFSFDSRVLIEEMENLLYSVVEGSIIDATHVCYRHEGPRTESGNRPWNPEAFVCASLESIASIKAGGSYFMPAYVCHATRPLGDGRLATIMKKTRIHESYDARSLCAVNVKPDADFDRQQLSEGEMWSFVLEVLGASESVQAAADHSDSY